MEDLTRVLRAQPFFDDLDDAKVAVLVGCARNARFAPGELLLREGDPATVFYLVREGRVSLDEDIPGHEGARGKLRVETVTRGDIIGVSWMFPPDHVHLDARAVENVLALAFDATCLRGKMEADPALGFAIARRLLALTMKRLERVRLQRLDVYRAP
jgi:CRP-like cAMP-binding protein